MALSDYDSDDFTEIASRVMYELLGRRWIWPPVTTTERLEVPSQQRFLILAGRPVTEILSVKSQIGNGVTTTLGTSDYTLENGYRLRLNLRPFQNPYWCGGNGLEFEVEYTYGAEAPLEVKVAIEALAEQLTLAANGDEECQLPERVTSISRQGISMTVIDPQDFLDEGRTGVALVDQALSRFNPSRARRPARVYSPTNPPPRRRNTTQETV